MVVLSPGGWRNPNSVRNAWKLQTRCDRVQRRAQSNLHFLPIVIVEFLQAHDQAARNGENDQELADGAPDQFFIRPQLRRLEQCKGAERVERDHFRYHLPAALRKDSGWR